MSFLITTTKTQNALKLMKKGFENATKNRETITTTSAIGKIDLHDNTNDVIK